MKKLPTKFNLVLSGLMVLLLTSCGGGSGGDTGTNNETPSTGEGSGSGPSGLITIDTSYSSSYKGIYSFRISKGKATSKGFLEAMGRKPSRHSKGKIVFKKECGGVIKNEIAILGTDGITTPITPCITDLGPILKNTLPYYLSLPYYGRAKLSPDESLIAVEIDFRGGYSGHEDKTLVLVFDMSGTIQHRYDDAFNPVWLPDGRLLIVSSLGNQDGMHITDNNLNNPTLIKNKPLGSLVDYVAISPSGKQLVFVYNYQIWMMNIDGSGLKRIVTGSERMKAPTWSPNGKYIAFFTNDHEGLIYGYHRRILFLNIATDKINELATNGNVFKDKGAFSLQPRGPISWTK